jgi:hypothetical protein
MFIGRGALTTSPALIRSSQGSPVIGTRRATGWPRSVISIDSPAATSSRYLLACCRNSRTPIVFMCYMVAHMVPADRHGASPYLTDGNNPKRPWYLMDNRAAGNGMLPEKQIGTQRGVPTTARPTSGELIGFEYEDFR